MGRFVNLRDSSIVPGVPGACRSITPRGALSPRPRSLPLQFYTNHVERVSLGIFYVDGKTIARARSLYSALLTDGDLRDIICSERTTVRRVRVFNEERETGDKSLSPLSLNYNFVRKKQKRGTKGGNLYFRFARNSRKYV